MSGRMSRRNLTPVTEGTTRRSAPPAQDLASSDPDWLRERVCHTLTGLSPDERSHLCDALLSDLENAGVNLISGLIKLGIPATKPDELSPNDIAKLMRYIRMNRPEAMTIVSTRLRELVAGEEQTSMGAKPLKKAA